ncbi:hypothetical protein [Williamsia sp. CHRR-6]|uniref:hypothetical protein n=1 Tax=Williamsia sp. CHRR-6 TaxID=2835871 RepID=UPI001BDA42E4|nr:hypothetical protein [Williamsia sp. CHRR-6]MBT0565527.1 hypothetical protein [Williamsia sp. CHRR-6]
MGRRTISDHDISWVLYTATGVINPLLDVLEDTDLLGLKKATFARPEAGDSVLDTVAGVLTCVVDHTGSPGTATWERWSLDQRTDWWVSRIGSLTSVLVAYPGVFGALANRLPLRDLLGFAQQAFIICAVQRVHGVHDRYLQTDQLVAVLCDRIVDSRRLLGKADVEAAPEIAAAVAATGRTRPGGVRGVIRAVRETVGLLRSISDVLTSRPTPKQPWKFLGELPVVGAVAGYFGERSALRRATDSVVASLKAPVRV